MKPTNTFFFLLLLIFMWGSVCVLPFHVRARIKANIMHKAHQFDMLPSTIYCIQKQGSWRFFPNTYPKCNVYDVRRRQT